MKSRHVDGLAIDIAPSGFQGLPPFPGTGAAIIDHIAKGCGATRLGGSQLIDDPGHLHAAGH
jgi:hypothetical protein